MGPGNCSSAPPCYYTFAGCPGPGAAGGAGNLDGGYNGDDSGFGIGTQVGVGPGIGSQLVAIYSWTGYYLYVPPGIPPSLVPLLIGSDLLGVGKTINNDYQNFPIVEFDGLQLVVNEGLGNQGGGGGRGGNSSEGETDNAKELARALQASGVQSLTNPCSIALWYGSSALIGTATAGEVQAAVYTFAENNWPGAVNFAWKQFNNWANNPKFILGPTIALALKYGEKGVGAMQQGCNALQ